MQIGISSKLGKHKRAYALLCVLALAAIIAPAQAQKLTGIGEYQSIEPVSHMISSLEGGRPFQINGEGFDPDLSAADHTVHFKSNFSTELGPLVSNDQDFQSSMSAGFIFYETPKLDDILPDSRKGTISEISPIVHVKDDKEGLEQTTFGCDVIHDCDILYSIQHTPQVFRVYPSTVYPGQDVCFEVFTDRSALNGREALKSVNIGGYTTDLGTYYDYNLERVRDWFYHHECVVAGNGIANPDNDVTLKATVGDYKIGHGAKSADETGSYIVKTAPRITEISHSSISHQSGSIIRVRGDGFHWDPSLTTIDVEGNPCEIVEITGDIIRCQLEVVNTDYSGTETFSGGIGSHVVEHDGILADMVEDFVDAEPIYKHFTDMTVRQQTNEDLLLTRIIETWFIPPQDGDYVFHGSCAAKCIVDLATTPDDIEAASHILTAEDDGWRNTWAINPDYVSEAQSLEGGKKYFMKITYDDEGGDEHMNIGFTINDDSTSRPDSYKGWNRAAIDPNHVFESFSIEIPNNPDMSYRFGFLSDSTTICVGLTNPDDIFDNCTPNLCPCVTDTFHQDSTEDNFRDYIGTFFRHFHHNYGVDVDITKEEIGGGTAFKFTAQFKYALDGPSFSEVRLFGRDASTETNSMLSEGADYSFTRTDPTTLTKPMSGSFRINVIHEDGAELITDDIIRTYNEGQILREILRVAPSLLGEIEIRESFKTFADMDEGREFFWRVSEAASAFRIEIIDSADDPLKIGDSVGGNFDIINDLGFLPSSNKPFYEAIPAEFLRTVEDGPQITVTSNGLTAACPWKGACGFNFAELAGTIDSYTPQHGYEIFLIGGTNIDPQKVEYVSFGKCTCELHPSFTVSETEIYCILKDCPAGDHEVFVQTTHGAMTPSGSNIVNIPITVDNVIPKDLYESGGQLITITGANFPGTEAIANNLGDFTIEFTGGRPCTLKTISETEITCIGPDGLLVGSADLTLSFSGLSHTETGFTVSAPDHSVVAIDKTSVSAVQKQNLVITADGKPSEDLNEYHGVIVSTQEAIKMKVNEITENGSNFDFKVRYPGAPRGDIYTVYLVHNDQRFASTTILSTETVMSTVTVEGGANNDVSIHGGNTLTITGTAFTTDIDNLALVVGNQKAQIISSTGTEVKARIPSVSILGEAEVTFFQKPNIEVPCGVSDGCKVNYIDDGASVEGDELAIEEGVVTIKGTNFGDNPKGFIGEFEQTTISASPTEIKIALTNIPDPAAIDLEVRTDGANLPKFDVALPIEPLLLATDPKSGSMGGQLLTITTFGLGTQTTSNIRVHDVAFEPLCEDDTVTIVDSSTITCITKEDHKFDEGVHVRMTFTHTDTSTGKHSDIFITCYDVPECSFISKADETPTISGVTSSGNDLSATIDNFAFDDSYTITVYYGTVASTSVSVSGSTVTGTFAEAFTPGNTDVQVKFEKDGVVTLTQSVTENLNPGTIVGPSSSTPCSFVGGCILPLNLENGGSIVANSGLKTGATAGDVTVTVCGNPATFDLESSTDDTLVVLAPGYVNSHSQSNFEILSDIVVSGTLVSDSLTGSLAFDGLTTTKVTGTEEIGVGYDFGTGKIAQLNSVRYFMGQMTDKQTNCVDKVKFQSSSDGENWTDIFKGGRLMKKGWNTHEFDTPVSSQFFRLAAEDIESCPIVEIEMIGNIFIDDSATSKTCDVEVTVGTEAPVTLSGSVDYKDSATTTVTDISPRYGGFKGGDTVTITGTGFNAESSETAFLIDGIPCAISSVSSTTITCVTSARPSVVDVPTTVLTFSSASGSNGFASMQENVFTYANYWSDPDTWGGEYAPQDGETVIIPAGQMLIVDIDVSPNLYTVMVEGSMVFMPDADKNHQRTFDAGYIFVGKGGVFEVGTPENRYTSKLTITMHGTREGLQIPVYGNKGIFVRHAQFDMHGAERDVTWTELENTLEIGGKEITLLEKVDWQVGERIVIASTDFSLEHTEEFVIEAIDNSQSGGSVITLDKLAKHKHFAETKDYTGSNGVNPDMTKTLTMRAEVALMTRNVVYKGADDDSIENQYGAHIMLHSPGDQSLTGRISYVELTQVGQAFQLGRYPIHFHMIGTVHGSYIKGNSIHHTYNRACTVHGVQYLHIENNLAYQTMGHTFFIEDAAETNNYLVRNLAMKTMRSWSLLDTDQSPASFWITHPNNYFIDNHAAGSAHYGFWFDLQETATGPSYDPDICPEYETLGEFTGNVAHSNGRYGLRFFHKYVPLEDPCSHKRGDEEVHVPTQFRDFTSYKNNRTGVIAEELGALKLHNFAVADNLFAGFEFGKTDKGPWLTEDDEYHLQDALVVGFSENAEIPLQTQTGELLADIGENANEKFGGMRGIKGARTERMRIKDVLFANFNHEDADWAPIGTCSHCEGPGTDSSGRTYFFKNTYFTESDRRVMFDTPFREIIYDEDGTLGNGTHRWIAKYFSHMDVPECERNEDVYNGLLCDKSISIRRIIFHDINPANALDRLPGKIINLRHIETGRRVLSNTCGDATDTNTWASIKENDDNLLKQQNDLQQAYHDKKVYTTEKKLAEMDYDMTQSPEDEARVTEATEKLEAAEATIAELEPNQLVEGEYKTYDELWKTDTLFCDDNNFQEVVWRKKKNPVRHWGFNVITGYEYNFHFDQGVDFKEVEGEYSYNELLDGETQGIILHMNHTESREAFNFTYPDPDYVEPWIDPTLPAPEVDQNEGLIVNKWQDEYLTNDENSKMGDVYFNNVTRHIQIKMDGQNPDATRFRLKADECISAGDCNPLYEEPDVPIEMEYRRWSNPESWPSGELPKAGEEVVIEASWNMLYDLEDSPVYQSITIFGRLTFENNDVDRIIRSYLIFNRKGLIIVGTEEEPFTATMTFEMHGSKEDKDIYFNDDIFEGGNKAIANTGGLSMYGKPVDVKITRLAESALVGATTITVLDTPADWKAGDQLGIAPSGRDWQQKDSVTIASVSGNVITLNEPLEFEHYGAAEVDEEETASIDVRAEVVHLSRNIKIKGTNTNDWGAIVVTAHNDDAVFVDNSIVRFTRKGWAILDHVEFYNCSQYDSDKAAVRFVNFYGELGENDNRSKLTNSAIHNGMGIGIMVKKADDVTLDGNIVWSQYVGGIFMKESHNTKINNNIVAGMGTRYWSAATMFDEIASYDICNKFQACTGLEMKNNIAAGGPQAGFVIPTACDESLLEYEGNSVHSVRMGVFLLSNALCTAGKHYFGNFHAYKVSRNGILGFQTFGEITILNYASYDNGVGAAVMSIGSEFSYLSIKDSIIIGESTILPKDAEGQCVPLYGMFTSSSTDVGKTFPEPSPARHPLDGISGEANWFTEGFHYNLTFKNFPSATRQHCADSTAVEQKMVYMNPSAPDHIPVDRFIGTKLHNVGHDAITTLELPNPGWAIIKECGDFPCTGPLNGVLKFEETSYTGDVTPDLTDAQFQIIPNNPEAANDIETCEFEAGWNAFLCRNPKIGQLVFESLDADRETRLFSPINFLGMDKLTNERTPFNNTMNSFMDHGWDGHYTAQERLSRFPGIVEYDRKYEIYFTGTQPANTRYVLQGADDGDFLIAQIDYSQSIVYQVSYQMGHHGVEVPIDSKRYNRTIDKPNPIDANVCGDSRYEQAHYIYEFVITKGCTVYLRAQDHLIGLMRLKMSIDEFFEDDFTNNLAYFLGITTDKIRIVGIAEGSVVAEFQLLSGKPTQDDRQDHLLQMKDKLQASYEGGELDAAMKSQVMDLTMSVIASDGSILTSETESYKKKEIHAIVFALLSISGLALIFSVIYAVFKMMRMGKTYNEVINDESVVSEKMEKKEGDNPESKVRVLTEQEFRDAIQNA